MHDCETRRVDNMPQVHTLNRRLRIWRVAWALASGIPVACGGYSTTTRMVDGQIITGEPVAPQAYAAYFDGRLKELSGDQEGALESYRTATEFEHSDPEVWTSLGRLGCRLGLSGADDDFTRAIELDAKYAPAWIERSTCETFRGNPARALEYAKAAQVAAPYDFDTTALLAQLYEGEGRLDAAIAQWLGYLAAHQDDRRAWQKLWSLSSEHGKLQWQSFATKVLGRSLMDSAEAYPEGDNERAAPNVLHHAIQRDDIATARTSATEHRISQVHVLELALTYGRTGLALAQAKLLVPAYPHSGDVRALALLAASRANDRPTLHAWLALPEQLSTLSKSGEWALGRLLLEQSGLTKEELTVRQASPER